MKKLKFRNWVIYFLIFIQVICFIFLGGDHEDIRVFIISKVICLSIIICIFYLLYLFSDIFKGGE